MTKSARVATISPPYIIRRKKGDYPIDRIEEYDHSLIRLWSGDDVCVLRASHKKSAFDLYVDAAKQDGHCITISTEEINFD